MDLSLIRTINNNELRSEAHGAAKRTVYTLSMSQDSSRKSQNVGDADGIGTLRSPVPTEKCQKNET